MLSEQRNTEPEVKAMKCRICGSTKLGPDHAGYYFDAEDSEGRPYCCIDYLWTPEQRSLHAPAQKSGR